MPESEPSAKNVRKWTPEDLALLRDLTAEGKSDAYLADRFSTTSDNIRQVRSRAGIRRTAAASPGTGPAKARGIQAALDVASRIAGLLGETPLPPARRAEIADADLLRYAGRAEWPPEALESLREHVGRWLLSSPTPVADDVLQRVLGLEAFASELCHMDLDDPQLVMAAAVLASKRTLVLAGRRVGKSHALGLIAAWSAVCIPNSQIVILGAADRQAKEIAERVVMPLFAQDDRLFASIRASNKELMELRNGSMIRFLPATGTIRGIGATLLLVDEGRDIQNEDLVYSSIEPFLANSNGSMAIFSTPWMASGKLWDAWHSPFWARVKVPSRESRFVSEEYLDSQRVLMSAQMYGAEFEADFMESVAGYFSAESISRCLRNYGLHEVREEGRKYSLGVDFGRYRDASVFIVVSKDGDGHLRVEWVKAFVNVPLSDQRPYARYLDNVFHFSRVVVEAQGLGIQISEEIRRDLGGRVELFKPTIGDKARAFEYAKGVVERGEIHIPTDPPQLAAQLRALEFEVKAVGISIHGANGSADDYAHAFAYAVWGHHRGSAGIVVMDSRIFESPLEAIANQNRWPRTKDVVRGIRASEAVGTCISCGSPVLPNQPFRDSATVRGVVHMECRKSN